MAKRRRVIGTVVVLGGLCASMWAMPSVLQRIEASTGGFQNGSTAGLMDDLRNPKQRGAVDDGGRRQGMVLVVPNQEGLTPEARAALQREAERERDAMEGGGERVIRVVPPPEVPPEAPSEEEGGGK